MFVDMIERVKEQTVANLFRLQLAREEDVEALSAPRETTGCFQPRRR